MQKKKKIFSGVTLVETVMYVAILSVMLVSIASFIGVSEHMKKRDQAISEVEMQGREAMRTMIQTIKNAQSITIPALGTTTATLMLVVDDSGKSPTVFDTNAGALRMKEGVSTAINLTSSKVTVSNLSFSNAGWTATKGSIVIQFNVAYADTSTNYTKTFYGTADPK